MSGRRRPATPGHGDSVPWYRQFWPWFLIALPGSVVIAALTTVVIASRHADDLVVDDYYESGLAINRQLEKRDAAHDRGYAAELFVADDSVLVETRGIDGYGELRIRFSHPMEADRDFSARLRRIAPHRFAGRLETPIAAHWHWILDAGEDSDWRLDGSLGAGDFRRVGDG
jgi:hypothetical protein